MNGPVELGAEDAKIVTLARSTRVRVDAAEGAAVRDTTGRTYTAATVDLPGLSISALRLAVAMAASSGADGLEAAAVVSGPDGALEEADLLAVGGLAGADVPVYLAGGDGEVHAVGASLTD